MSYHWLITAFVVCSTIDFVEFYDGMVLFAPLCSDESSQLVIVILGGKSQWHRYDHSIFDIIRFMHMVVTMDALKKIIILSNSKTEKDLVYLQPKTKKILTQLAKTD